MARTKKESNTTVSQIGEVKQAILVLKNQLEEIKKKIKEKEVELEQLENKQKLETVTEIVKIAEGEGVSLADILAALQRDKSLITLIADEVNNNADEEEDIIDEPATNANNPAASADVSGENNSSDAAPALHYS